MIFIDFLGCRRISGAGVGVARDCEGQQERDRGSRIGPTEGSNKNILDSRFRVIKQWF